MDTEPNEEIPGSSKTCFKHLLAQGLAVLTPRTFDP